jgi:tryptophanyl-tRNA synthetase
MGSGIRAIHLVGALPEQVQSFKVKFEDGSLRFVELKDAVAEAIFAQLQPMQEKRKKLEADPAYVDRVIAEGAAKARKVAKETIAEVRQKMGLA